MLDLQNPSWEPGKPPWTIDLRVAVGKEFGEGAPASVGASPDEGGYVLVTGEREYYLRCAPEGARLGFHFVERLDGQRELRIRLAIVTQKPVRVELEYSW